MSLWDVHVAEHRVTCGRRVLDVAAHTSVVRAEGQDDARAEACRRAHRDSAVPPWRPLLRQTWPHSTAKTWIDPNPLPRRRR